MGVIFYVGKTPHCENCHDGVFVLGGLPIYLWQKTQNPILKIGSLPNLRMLPGLLHFGQINNFWEFGKEGVIMMAVLAVLLWAAFRFILPIVLLIVIGTVVNQKYYGRSVIWWRPWKDCGFPFFGLSCDSAYQSWSQLRWSGPSRSLMRAGGNKRKKFGRKQLRTDWFRLWSVGY